MIDTKKDLQEENTYIQIIQELFIETLKYQYSKNKSILVNAIIMSQFITSSLLPFMEIVIQEKS